MGDAITLAGEPAVLNRSPANDGVRIQGRSLLRRFSGCIKGMTSTVQDMANLVVGQGLRQGASGVWPSECALARFRTATDGTAVSRHDCWYPRADP